jgi:hypothetical protein
MYVTCGGQAATEGAGANVGPILIFGLDENAGYEGKTGSFGGTLLSWMGGVEGDISVSQKSYQGKTPVVVFVGLGVGAEASAYAGQGLTIKAEEFFLTLEEFLTFVSEMLELDEYEVFADEMVETD